MSINTLSSLSIPILILFIVVSALFRNVSVYDVFLCGAKKGLKTSVSIAAPLVGLLSAIAMLRASGATELICYALNGFATHIGFPKEVLPLALIRPISGSASTAMLRDIFINYGTDTFIGRVASVISGSSETTFYTMAVYFGAINIKNSRHTAASALLADLTCFLVAGSIVSGFF